MHSKSTFQSPSQVLRIGEWAGEMIGFEYDWLTAYLFDGAITMFGNYVEGKLNDPNNYNKKTGKIIVGLSEILKTKKLANKMTLEQQRRALAAVGITMG